MSLLQHEIKARGKHKLWNMPVRKVTSFTLDSPLPVFYLKLIHTLLKVSCMPFWSHSQPIQCGLHADIPTIVC